MSFEKILEIELTKFLNTINDKYGISLSLDDFYSINEKRCLARKWDCPWKKDQDLKCDINKQCKNKAKIGNLCKLCYNSKKISMIYERPYEEMFDMYNFYITKQQKLNNPDFLDRDIEKELNIKQYEKYMTKSRKKSKIIKNKDIMGTEQNVKEELLDSNQEKKTMTDNVQIIEEEKKSVITQMTDLVPIESLVSVYLKDLENLFEEYVYLLDKNKVIYSEFIKENNVCKEKQYIIGSYRYNLNQKRHLEITIFPHDNNIHDWKVKTYKEYRDNTITDEILIEKFD